MHNLPLIMDGIEKELDEKDTVREIALKSTRALVRMANRAIRAAHKGEDRSAYLKEMKDELSSLLGLLSEHPDIYHTGFVENAFQEVAEAYVLDAILNGAELPSPRYLGITSTSFLLGMGDIVGELRRFALDMMREGNLDEAVRFQQKMEDVYDELMRFHYPSALVSVRRKQDIARSLLEKTRGELAVAARGKALEDKLSGLNGGVATGERYECAECGKTHDGEEAPECCGQPMRVCTSAQASAEHARPMEDEEPCDDSRG